MSTFAEMWEQQSEFVKLLQKKRGFPETPVDLSKKDGQKFVKSLVYETMTELFEALVHLKNSKSHRATEIKEFERNEFVEELVDGGSEGGGGLEVAGEVAFRVECPGVGAHRVERLA